jgi:hypothetical protein
MHLPQSRYSSCNKINFRAKIKISFKSNIVIFQPQFCGFCGFHGLEAVLLCSDLLWCYQHFRGMYHHHVQCENEGSMFLQNLGNHLQDHVASQSIRPQSTFKLWLVFPAPYTLFCVLLIVVSHWMLSNSMLIGPPGSYAVTCASYGFSCKCFSIDMLIRIKSIILE